MKEEPYLSSEDSAFLREVLRRYRGGVCLEIGAGNAGILVDLTMRFVTVVGTDLVRPSMMDWKGAGANYVIADGSSCVADASCDLVAFNPPYLGGAGMGDRAVDGGKGLDVPIGFLAGALRAVKPDGKVVFLLNGDADLGAFRELCREVGFGLKKIESKRLFFEELAVYEASANDG